MKVSSNLFNYFYRDALLATLLDGVRASGNCDVHVKMQATNRGQRFGPLYFPLDEEVETNHLKFLVSFPGEFLKIISFFKRYFTNPFIFYYLFNKRL